MLEGCHARLRTPRTKTLADRALTRLRLAQCASALALLATACGDDGAGGSTATTATGGITTLTTGGGDTTAGDAEGDSGDKLDLGPAADLEPETGGECVSQMADADLTYRPVDVLVVVDTSASMGAAIAAMEASINDDFAAILEASGLDYRVIVAADYPTVCIAPPLSGTDCDAPPSAPVVTANYAHYDSATGSGAFLDNIVAWASAPDTGGLMPGGYVDALRPDAVKTVVGMTDGTSASNDTTLATAFDDALLALPGAPFGSAGDRQYVFHLFTSMPVNNPPAMPWGPADPLAGEGQSIQQVAVLTGGLRFPFTQTQDFASVFNTIATGVVEATPIACEFAIPEPPPGESIDPDTIEIDYTPAGGGIPETFHQVVGPADCAADAFYIADAMVFLCPEACAIVQADTMAHLDVRYGCDVGFDPQG